SQPQNLSQAICAQIDAKIKPPSVKSGNPIATARYDISSNKFGLIFFKRGCINAPSRLRIIRRYNPYLTTPTISDQIHVLNVLLSSSPCIHSGAVNNALILSSETSFQPDRPRIGGK